MARARTNKRVSFNHQVHQRMEQLKCFGESRHQAKQEYEQMIGTKNANNRTVGIHSYNTYDAYKSSLKSFSSWAKDENIKFKKLDDVKEEHIKDFIKDRYEEGYSAHTYSKDLAALNKVFNTHVTKEQCGVANRSYLNISNNREMKEHHNKINYNNYSNPIAVVQATGMRRSNVEKVTPNTFNYNENGLPTQIRLCDERKYGGDNWSEKGGRDRVVDIPEEHQERIKEIIDEHRMNGYDDNKPLFEHIPSRLGTHRFRQEFAETSYNNYIEKHGEGTLRVCDVIEKSDSESTTYRGYDVGALKYATEQLGHNRLDVIVYNYLRV
ncbi:MAG: site-specific integrase [Clostridium sp.]|nr:site-specific integrase [Clostridium sp.]